MLVFNATAICIVKEAGAAQNRNHSEVGEHEVCGI